MIKKIDKFKVGDIIVIWSNSYYTSNSKIVKNIISFGRIRRIENDYLVVKVILIPGNLNLVRMKLKPIYITSKKSLNFRRYFIIHKTTASILINNNKIAGNYDYKALLCYARIKYSELIREGWIDISI
jgi:hypothetical protein